MDPLTWTTFDPQKRWHPARRQWEAFGGTVWVNDRPLPAPSWLQPGANRYLRHTYSAPANEDPYTDEEFYWTRGPVEIQLHAGWNKVLLRVPCGYEKQNWTFSFAPVRHDPAHNRWIEDETVKFSDQLEPAHP